MTRRTFSGHTPHLRAKAAADIPRSISRIFISNGDSLISESCSGIFVCSNLPFHEGQQEHNLSHLEMSTRKITSAEVRRGRKPKDVEPGTLGAKVRAARDKAGLTTTELGKRIQVSNVTITHIETGQTTPADRTLRLLAEELRADFDLAWLKPHVASAKAPPLQEGETVVYFGDEEQRIINKLAKAENRTFAEQARELALEALMHRGLATDRLEQSDVVFLADYLPQPKKMRLLGEIAAGEPLDVYPRSETIEVPAYKLKAGREYFVLRVRGNSMIDEGIHDGSFIICEAAETAKRGDRVVALIDGQRATVKKYYPERGRIRLQPANKLHQPIYVQPDQLRIQGIVIGTWRPS